MLTRLVRNDKWWAPSRLSICSKGFERNCGLSKESGNHVNCLPTRPSETAFRSSETRLFLSELRRSICSRKVSRTAQDPFCRPAPYEQLLSRLQHFKDVFGEALFTKTSDGPLLSPNDLKRRFLISTKSTKETAEGVKGAKKPPPDLPPVAEGQIPAEEPEDDIRRELSALVFWPRVLMFGTP